MIKFILLRFRKVDLQNATSTLGQYSGGEDRPQQHCQQYQGRRKKD